MKELIRKYDESGICEVDTDKVAAAWNDRFSISQFHEKYRLVEQIELFKEDAHKVAISQEQALEIIAKVNLLPIYSSLFRHGTTWRSESNIISERDRIEAAVKDSTDIDEKRVLQGGGSWISGRIAIWCNAGYHR